jgi:hypothetical protein
MFFGDYKSHSEAQVRKSLLWEYDLKKFDWSAMRDIVVQRVVERGRMDDFYAVLNLYGEEGVKESIRKIPCMSQKDIAFVCAVFNLKKEELKCCSKAQSKVQHWDF